MEAMRPSVRPITASTSGTRATSTSPSTTPMTMFTPTIRRCTPCVERVRTAHCFTLYDDTAHFMAQVLSPFIVIHGHIHGRTSLTRFSFSTSTCSFLSFSVYFLHSELFSELGKPIVMESLCYSANKESEDAYDVSTSFTGYEPNVLTFGELNDSSVPFTFMIPSSDQDVDDVTLGKMLT